MHQHLPFLFLIGNFVLYFWLRNRYQQQFFQLLTESQRSQLMLAAKRKPKDYILLFVFAVAGYFFTINFPQYFYVIAIILGIYTVYALHAVYKKMHAWSWPKALITTSLWLTTVKNGGIVLWFLFAYFALQPS